MKKICILFTRVPYSGKTKTRLFDFVTRKQAAEIQTKLLQNIYKNLLSLNIDIKIFHNGEKKDDKFMSEILKTNTFYYQKGNNLGEKMYNAFLDVYQTNKPCKIILIGSDIAENINNKIKEAFEKLDKNDIVINPTFDGGYYLVGMKKPIKEIFELEKYGKENVFKKTIEKIKKTGLTYSIGEKALDIDTKEDILTYETGYNKIKLLGKGEYNINFLYEDEKEEKRVLRVNIKSQMNLKNQIQYEYEALKILEKSTVTPKVYEFSQKNKILPYGYLTMQYLEGRVLDYNKDMETAAYLLGKIHTTKIPDKNNLIIAENPLLMMYEECLNMANIYLNWEKRDLKVSEYLKFFLEKCKKQLNKKEKIEKVCLINTELNNTNFIIGENKEKSYIIDWEKPLLGECEQDLAHFLVPTTTFFRTEKILTKKEILGFLKEYEKYNNYNYQKFLKYFTFNCLRGISWSGMAYKEYQEKEKILVDNFIFNKIKSYLDIEFLKNIQKYFKEE